MRSLTMGNAAWKENGKLKVTKDEEWLKMEKAGK